MRRNIYTGVGLVLLLAVACEGTGEPVAGRGDAIRNGVPDVSTPERDAVGNVVCTGTLISSRVVLSARHCGVERLRGSPETWGVPASAMLFNVGLNVVSGDTVAAAKVCQFNYGPIDEAYPTSSNVTDVVLFLLDRRVGVAGTLAGPPIPVVPMRALTRTPGGADPVSFWPGQPIELIGYGPSVDSGSGEGRLVAPGRIRDVSPFLVDTHRILSDLAADLPIIPGDSGGPSVWTEPVTGRRVVVGVHRSVDGTDYSTFGSRFVGPWLERTLDPDGDGVWLGDPDIDPALDVDGDGLRADDNCPAARNIDQLDTDCDGMGDACDPCPHNGSIAPTTDTDRDGFADDCDVCPQDAERGCRIDADCAGRGDRCDATLGTEGRCARELDTDDDAIPDACDRCDFARSYGRAGNCNAEMERQVLGAENGINGGDQCDSTPCPFTSQVLRNLREELPPRRTPPPPLPTLPGVPWVTNAFVVTSGVAGDGLIKSGITTHRFCLCATDGDTEQDRIDCETRIVDPMTGELVSGGCAIDGDMPGRSEATTTNPWRRTTLSPKIGSTFGRPRLGPEFTVLYDSGIGEPAVWRWDFETDAARYGWPIDVRVREPSLPVFELRGVTWSFASRYIDCLDMYSTPPYQHVPCPTFNNRLSSYFTSGLTFRTLRGTAVATLPGLAAPALIPRGVCPECGEQIPMPWLGVELCPFGVCPSPDVFIRVGTLALPAGPAVTPRLAQALADPMIRWLAPSDGGYVRDLPVARLVGIDARGFGMRATAIVTGSGSLGLPGDQPVNVLPPSDGASEAQRDWPADRFAAVYDAADGEVWMLGGFDGNGEPLRSAFRLDLEDGRWVRVPLDRQIGAVVTATMAGALPLIYVIDADAAHMRRLLEVDTRSGAVRVLAEGRGPEPVDRIAVRADLDGSFYVIVGSETSGRHRVVLYSRDLAPLGSMEGDGVQTGDPFVTFQGLTIPVRLRDGSDLTVGYLRAAMHGRSGSPLRELL